MPVGLVFYDDDIVFLAHGVDVPFAGEGNHVAGWVVGLAVIWVSGCCIRGKGDKKAVLKSTYAIVYIK